MTPPSVFLVTGASRGIGAAVARALAAPGRTVGINFKASRDAAEAVARDVERKGARALLLPGDVTSEKDVDAMFESLAAGPGRLDVLISNAGVPFAFGRLPQAKLEAFELQWRTQVQAAFLCCRRAVPLMASSGGGRIVFVLSSVAQGAPPAFMAPYVSAKYAVLGLAKALKVEAAAKGVSVRCVYPPMTETDFIKDFPRPIVEAERERNRSGRLETPEETAQRVLAAALDASPEAAA